MSQQLIHVDVEEFVQDTGKAVLVKVADGRNVWIPLSCIDEVHREKNRPMNDKGWLLVKEWFANKENLT